MTLWTLAHQALLSMGFPKLEYWSGLPFPLPEDLPDPRIKPASPALAGGFFTTEPSEEYRFLSFLARTLPMKSHGFFVCYYCCCSVTKSHLTLCHPMFCSTPGFPVLYYVLEFAQTHVHGVTMPSNHLIICCPLLLLPSIFPNGLALHIRWPTYLL